MVDLRPLFIYTALQSVSSCPGLKIVGQLSRSSVTPLPSVSGDEEPQSTQKHPPGHRQPAEVVRTVGIQRAIGVHRTRDVVDIRALTPAILLRMHAVAMVVCRTGVAIVARRAGPGGHVRRNSTAVQLTAGVIRTRVAVVDGRLRGIRLLAALRCRVKPRDGRILARTAHAQILGA